jgi:hypothetical protein
MPADERIKVIFKRVYVVNNADWFGSGEFYFDAKIDGKAVGDKRIFDAREGAWINLDAALWSLVVDVSKKASVAVSFHGYDEDVFLDDDLGSISHVLKPPWAARDYRKTTKYFLLEWSVELAVDGKFGVHGPKEVFATRSHNGALSCNTIDGSILEARLEFHPVIPTPSDVPTVPPSFPKRPPALFGTAKYNTGISGGVAVTAASPINVLPNPSVIPILSPPPPAAAPGAGSPPVADATNAARIEFSYYQPDSLAFTDSDPRLEWSWTALAGGAIDFLGPKTGLKVMVYGTAAGEVLLTVKYKGADFATYRALVKAVKKIPARFNILNGPAAPSQPLTTPADVLNHVAIANCYLRQVGVELAYDTNATVTDGATAVRGSPGIFRIKVTAGQARNIPQGGHPKAAQMNFRDFVANFAYVHSDIGGNLGRATDRQASKSGATITDNGKPSTSWIPPTGIDPDPAAGTITMNLRPVMQSLKADGVTPKFPNLFAMYLTNANGSPSANPDVYANTLAHEFGHILNLAHRPQAGGDGLSFPANENLMHPSNPPAQAQDLDIIQARAVHQSPLVPP